MTVSLRDFGWLIYGFVITRVVFLFGGGGVVLPVVLADVTETLEFLFRIVPNNARRLEVLGRLCLHVLG